GREMSAWVEKKTGNRLKDAVKPALLAPNTTLALCNTIYFKGRWANQFRRSHTEPQPFSIATNQSVTVPMMYQKAVFKSGHVPYEDDLYLQLLELPYYGRDLSMIILLPGQVDGLPEVERQLSPARLGDWLADLDKRSPQTTHVFLPRFTIERSVDLKKELTSMGVATLFDMRADLSGMESSTNLYISDVLHQTFIEVNEHGTEAAAMTLTTAKTKGIDDRFVADHPFIFLIRDNATGSILFLGRVVDPTKP
ncbi:MAG TPA: serpin family protein, partial [Verrucomicrobiae bacterium]|nr:serpin family protein [Verrucomicrobiae bacterium]